MRLKKTIIYKKNLIVGCYLIKTILHLLRIHSLQPIHQAAVLPKDGLGVNQSTKRLSNKSIKPDNPDKIFKSFRLASPLNQITQTCQASRYQSI